MTTYIVSKTQKAILLLGLGFLGALLFVPTDAQAAVCPTPTSGSGFADIRSGMGWNNWDLSGGSHNVWNSTNDCSVPIGMKVFKVYSETNPQDGQTLFDSDSATLAPGGETVLSVSVPNCRYQLDSLIFPGEPYVSQMLMRGQINTALPVCSQPVTYCSQVRVNSNVATTWLIGGPQTDGQFLGLDQAAATTRTYTTDNHGAGLPVGTYGNILIDTNPPGGWYGATISPNNAQQCNASGSITWTLTYKRDGVCGSSNGGTFPVKPTTNLCSIGTASTVAGTGPWTWTCAGESGGLPASCSANIQGADAPSVNLQGKWSDGGLPYSEGPVQLPAGGGNVNLRWIVSGDATSCTASASPSVTGWTGSKTSSPDGTYAQTDIVNGATVRTYTITCSNAGGSDSDSVSVTIAGAPPINGVCQTPPNGGTYPTAPTGTLCSAGTATAIAGTGPWTWSCVGIGVGATTASCSANITGEPPVLACLPTTQQIGVRVPASITAEGATAPYTWNTGGGVGPVCAPSVSPCTQAYAVANTKTVTLTNSNGAIATCQIVVKGSVTVKSNQPTTWTLSGPNGVITETTQQTSETYANQTPGGYTISGVPALNGFTGPVITPVTASQSIPQTGADIEFRITYTPECTGDNCPGDDDDDTGRYLNLQAGEENGPLSEGPVKVLYNHKAVLSWATRNVVPGSCRATGGWTGDKVDNGVELSKFITDETLETFTLTCTKQGSKNSDALGTVSDSVQIGTRPPQCSDDMNNDDDKFIDWDGGGVGLKDPGCVNEEDDNEADQVPECRDGYDNADPEDKVADKEDPGCKDEKGAYNPNDNDETDKSVGTATQCNNGLDDDGDGYVDYVTVTPPDKKPDKGCSSEWDPSELDDPSIREI